MYKTLEMYEIDFRNTWKQMHQVVHMDYLDWEGDSMQKRKVNHKEHSGNFLL